MDITMYSKFNTLGPGQYGHHFGRKNFKHNFVTENVLVVIINSLNFVPKVLIDNKSSLVV